jgi:very-short-patch-repair endonuclease
MDDLDGYLLELSGLQHGFVLRSELGALTVRARAHRIERDWHPFGRRVLWRPGTPWTKASPLMLAVLDAGPGAVISGPTAGAWWGLPGFDLLDIHVTRPRGVTGSPARYAAHLHEVLDLSSEQVTVLDGIPIVRPERLAFDLCAQVHPLRAERAIDTGWSKGLWSGRSLRRLHSDLGGQGRKGTVVMRDILATRPDDWVPPASGLAFRVMKLFEGALLGTFRREVDLGDDERWIGRVDFKHATLPVIVEVQSERYHKALVDEAADAVRKARLEAAGFAVVEVWDTDVWHRPQVVIDAVRRAVWAARRRAA